jgi:hypothetical protein
MKLFIASLSVFWALSGMASPPPQDQQDQQDQDQQEQQQQQDQQECRHCSPRAYVCHARMVDCYGRPLYTYWGRMPQYQAACGVAMNLCLRDAHFGYGGYGARCLILGK